MGREAKVKAATRHARAVAKAHRWTGRLVAPIAAEIESMVPRDTARALRYRNVKRVVMRAVQIERVRLGPTTVFQGDSRVERSRAERARRAVEAGVLEIRKEGAPGAIARLAREIETAIERQA